MRDVTARGPYKDIVMLPSPADGDGALRFDQFVPVGVYTETFRVMRDQGLKSAIAQYYGNVQDGLMFAESVHLFRGLERPLMQGSNTKADQDMLVYSWVPRWDWEWDTGAQRPVERKPAPSRVFTILVQRFEKADEQQVTGTILHWAWVQEDWTLKGAPIDWEDRYAEKLWTKRKR